MKKLTLEKNLHTASIEQRRQSAVAESNLITLTSIIPDLSAKYE